VTQDWKNSDFGRAGKKFFARMKKQWAKSGAAGVSSLTFPPLSYNSGYPIQSYFVFLVYALIKNI